jgi:Raf kinase inhibitor-like YbhB/YbcL family protein
MRIASTVVLTALGLVLLAHGGVLACGASDANPADGAAGSAVTAGAAGAAVAGASGSGVAGAASAGAPAAGSGGAAAGAAGTAGASAASGGVAGMGGSGGAPGNAGSAGMVGSGGAAPFAITSPSFMKQNGCGKDNVAVCDKFAQDFWLTTIGGSNHSPELDWTPGPQGTLSYAVVLFDQSNTYAHWVIWNIPASTNKLPASLPAGMSPAGITGAKQVSFFGNKDAYAGPGAKSHAYQFKLYALKVATFSPNTAGEAQVSARNSLEASADVIAKVEIVAATPQ